MRSGWRHVRSWGGWRHVRSWSLLLLFVTGTGAGFLVSPEETVSVAVPNSNIPSMHVIGRRDIKPVRVGKRASEGRFLDVSSLVGRVTLIDLPAGKPVSKASAVAVDLCDVMNTTTGEVPERSTAVADRLITVGLRSPLTKLTEAGDSVVGYLPISTPPPAVAPELSGVLVKVATIEATERREGDPMGFVEILVEPADASAWLSSGSASISRGNARC